MKILREVEQLFAQQDDLTEIAEIKSLIAEIEAHVDSTCLDAKEVVKAYTKRVAIKEQEIMAPTEVAHAVYLEKFRDEKENASRQVDSLRKKMDEKREKIASLAQQTLSMMGKCKEAGVDTEMANSRTAYALSLYAKISNIAWDYKAPAGKLAGTIGNEESKRIKHFDIDTRSKTSFEVANTLWDMIGEGVSN